jgi:hypothetical protein
MGRKVQMITEQMPLREFVDFRDRELRGWVWLQLAREELITTETICIILTDEGLTVNERKTEELRLEKNGFFQFLEPREFFGYFEIPQNQDREVTLSEFVSALNYYLENDTWLFE